MAVKGKKVPADPLAVAKKALHLCLKRIKAANDETELRRLTEELQRILFRRQYLREAGFD